jgi:hypothetical protein
MAGCRPAELQSHVDQVRGSSRVALEDGVSH